MKSPGDIRWPLLVLLGAPFCLLLHYFLLQALTLIPGPDGDAIWFYPISLEFASHGLLEHPFRSPIDGADHRLTWHGWLYPALLGLFAGGLGFHGLFVAEMHLAMITYVIFAALLLRITTGILPLFFALSILTNVLFVFPGRPEALFAVLLGAGVLAVLSLRGGFRRGIVVGLLLGVMAAVQPVAALISATLFSAYCAYRMGLRPWLRCVSLAGIVSLATLGLLLLAVYPFPAGEWLRGVLSHGGHQQERGDGAGISSLVFYLVRSTGNPLSILWFLSLPVLAFHWRRAAVPWLHVVHLALLALLVWYFALRVPALNYNFFAFLPVLLLLWVPVALRSRGALAFLAVMGLLSVLAIGYRLVDQVHSVAAGGSYQDLVEAASVDGTLRAHDSYFFLLYEPSLGGRVVFSGEAEWLLVKQANTRLTEPPDVEGSRLVQSNFAPPLRLYGVTLLPVPRGYQYALYRRPGPEKETSPR